MFTFKYVHNTNKTIRCNSLEMYEKYLKDGWLPGKHYSVWNKGLTKETDKRVLKYSSNTANKKKTAEMRKKISEALRGRRIPREQIERRVETRKLTKPFQTEESKKKISQELKGHTVLRESIEKRKQTIISKYGSFKNMPHGHLSEESRQRISEHNKSAEFQKFQREKKILNGTINTSRPENCVYEKLTTAFKNDVVRYYSDERYPFECDFYIKSLDLFIECNFHWTHGGHPFDENDPRDQKTLEGIRKKQSFYLNDKGKKKQNYYFVFEDVWTKRDVLKLKMTKDNKLNYLTFYSLDNFNTWFEGSASDLGTYYHNNFNK